MSKRPFDLLRFGLLLLTLGALLIPTLLLWDSAQDGSLSFTRPGVVVALLLMATGVGLMWYSRRLRRSERPEWLETQAWRKDLADKLRKGPPVDP